MCAGNFIVFLREFEAGSGNECRLLETELRWKVFPLSPYVCLDVANERRAVVKERSIVGLCTRFVGGSECTHARAEEECGLC